MKKVLTAVACALLLIASSAFAGNSDAGATKFKEKGCTACHGDNGSKTVAPDFPRLAGQYEDYLVKALSDYKSGARGNPIMGGMVASLSEQDIEDLAAFFSSQKGLVVKH